jgi:PAS domain S-box-containing protein
MSSHRAPRAAKHHHPMVRHPLRNRPTLGVRQTIVIALALFAGFYALQALDTHPADALEVLYVVPIALLAVRFGARGGLVGALAGVAMISLYSFAAHVFDVSVLGTVCWAIAFVLLGALLGIFVDRRRRLELELSHYYDASLDLMATANLDGRFTRANRAWERQLGMSPETVCSRPFIEFVHPEDCAATIAETAALSDGSPHRTLGFRNRVRAADGSYRWFEWNVAAAPLDGELYVTGRDISATHEAEQQLAANATWLETKVADQTRELDEARAKTLQRLVMAAEYRDDETFQHAERVGTGAAEIATALGLCEDQIGVLRQAAPLHDIGKLAIPDRVLLKPGKLTAEEYEVMKSHAPIGARLLSGSGSPVLQMAEVIAENHHERWDGTGYPNGLAGEEIPLVGRVVAVADAFDALTHDRPYRYASPVEQAIAEIRRSAGSQLDPRVVDAFLAMRTEGAVGSQAGDPPQRPDAIVASRQRPSRSTAQWVSRRLQWRDRPLTSDPGRTRLNAPAGSRAWIYLQDGAARPTWRGTGPR